MPRGRSAASVLSDSSDLDFEGTAETELEKLQRQFRILEGDRQAYSIQSQEKIRKQRQEISKLREEQEELQRVLACHSHSKNDNQDTESIQTLLEQRNMLDDQLENERQTQTQLEQEIINMEKKLVEARRGEITASQSHTSQARHTQKAIRTLENKLDRALIRFNEQMAKNSQLREEIETLRIQRVRFQQLHHKLDKVLQDVHKDIGEVINMSTTAYDAREEAQTKMTIMKEKAIKDFAQYSAEMKELERVIAHERRLKEFMTTKSNERTAMDDGQEIRRRQEMKEQRRAEAGEETFDTLEEVFQRIKTLTGEDNLEILVTKFIEVEDRNFALFNFVNEQNIEAEKLREEIHQIGEEIKQLNIKGVQKEQENQVALKEVMDQLQECKTQTQQYEAQAEDISKILDQIKTGIESVFTKIDCDPTLVLDMLGSSSGITNSNLMTYISLVEQRTSEMLTIQAFIKSKDLEKSYDLKEVTQFLLGQKPDLQRHDVIVQPPITKPDYEAEDSSVTDEEDRPLTHKELRQRIMSSVVSKDESLRTGGSKDVKTPKSKHHV
ncbi:coiled-coil domain-containing protein 114 [Pseudorasbora parva]|uniref:coiled-coil domain-containing protein 114 n=1 Tax=Pseudorasbora parva TaxID=51549 RepID=UPI00351F1FE7